MTYGQDAVGLSFNPSGDADVNHIKAMYADIIDFLYDQRSHLEHPVDSEKARLYSIAITEAQGAQMWAVKAITWQIKTPRG